VELLTPSFRHLNGPLKDGISRLNFVCLNWPSGFAIAGRPIRAAQTGIGKANEATENDDADGKE
jgi:hypothetical protein